MPLFRNANPYRRRNALLPSGGVFLAGGLVLLAVLIFILQITVPGFLTSVASPFWSAGTALSSGITNAANVFGNSSELARERDQLANENLALAEANRALVARDADLAALTGAVPSAPRITAGVLARPPVAPYDTLIIAAGTAHGVAEGAFVYGPGGVPLGTVASVSGASSRVALFSTGGRVTEGWVGDARLPITLVGRGGGAFEATLPRDSGVTLNAVVYVPGPGALPIGTIVRIDTDPSAPRDTVHVAPYANVFSIPWVAVGPHP